MMNTVGLLYRDLPVAFRFDKNMNMGDIFATCTVKCKTQLSTAVIRILKKTLKL